MISGWRKASLICFWDPVRTREVLEVVQPTCDPWTSRLFPYIQTHLSRHFIWYSNRCIQLLPENGATSVLLLQERSLKVTQMEQWRVLMLAVQHLCAPTACTSEAWYVRLELLPVWQRLAGISLQCQISHEITQTKHLRTSPAARAAHCSGIWMCATLLQKWTKFSNIIVKGIFALLIHN